MYNTKQTNKNLCPYDPIEFINDVPVGFGKCKYDYLECFCADCQRKKDVLLNANEDEIYYSNCRNVSGDERCAIAGGGMSMGTPMNTEITRMGMSEGIPMSTETTGVNISIGVPSRENIYNKHRSVMDCQRKHDFAKGGLGMSIATACITKSGIVLIADSRSSKNIDNPAFSFTDDCNKIVYVKDLNLGIISTGVNKFDGKSFTEVIREEWQDVSKVTKTLDNGDKIKELIRRVNYTIDKAIRLSGGQTFITYAFYDYFASHAWSKVFIVHRYIISSNAELRELPKMTEAKMYNQGEDWAIAFLQRVTIDCFSASVARDELHSVFEDIKNIENKHKQQPVIGGEIQSLIIKEDGTADTSKLNIEAIIQ